ncbi:MAG: hypothetical protein WDM90_07415 [Ferruginibacter sp.]
MPIEFTEANGGKGEYQLKKGDQLVYHVNTGSVEYDFIVTLNDGGTKKALDFNYAMNNAAGTSGHVNISAQARAKARKYINYFSGGEMKLVDASSVWLTDANYADLDYGKAQLSFDGGPEETFYAEGNNDVGKVVKIKGVNRKIGGFSITNAHGAAGDKTLWINLSKTNPLIIKMNLGFTIELREIK